MNKIISYAEQEGLIKLAKSFIDGTFLRSKNGSDNVGKTKVGKGHKLMAIVDENGIPVSVNVTSANPHESQLVEDTLQKISTQQLPEKIIGDRAYDSDHLDDLMNEYNRVSAKLETLVPTGFPGNFSINPAVLFC